jgi:hypothetical protein
MGKTNINLFNLMTLYLMMAISTGKQYKHLINGSLTSSSQTLMVLLNIRFNLLTLASQTTFSLFLYYILILGYEFYLLLKTLL